MNGAITDFCNAVTPMPMLVLGRVHRPRDPGLDPHAPFPDTELYYPVTCYNSKDIEEEGLVEGFKGTLERIRAKIFCNKLVVKSVTGVTNANSALENSPWYSREYRLPAVTGTFHPKSTRNSAGLLGKARE